MGKHTCRLWCTVQWHWAYHTVGKHRCTSRTSSSCTTDTPPLKHQPSQPLPPTILLSVPMNLTVLSAMCEWNCGVFVLLWLISLGVISSRVICVVACVSMWSWSSPKSLSSRIWTQFQSSKEWVLRKIKRIHALQRDSKLWPSPTPRTLAWRVWASSTVSVDSRMFLEAQSWPARLGL